MNAYFLLLAKSVLSILLSVAVLYVLSRPLVNVLAKVCPDEESAVFWLTYTKLMLVFAPLLLVTVVDMFTQNSDPLDSLRFTMLAALSGMLIGLRAVGTRLAKSIKTPEQSGGVA